MPPSVIANATISFGLVSVPGTCTRPPESTDERVVQHVAQKCGGTAEAAVHLPEGQTTKWWAARKTVKGYEFAKDQYVVFSTEEIKAVEEKATNMIDVIEIHSARAVQREFMEKVYYIGPDKGGERAYRLLCEDVMQTGRAALGQYAAARQAEYHPHPHGERHPGDGVPSLRG